MAPLIAYLIHSFPQYSSTFINDEVDEMRRQGCRLALFAVQHPGPAEYPPAFARFRDETTYVFPIDRMRFFKRHLDAMARRPWSYASSLAWIATRPGQSLRDRVRSLFHFAEAVYLYPEIRTRGCSHVHVHFLFGGAAIALFLYRMYGLSYSLTAHGSDIFLEKALQAEKLAHSRYTRVATEYNAAYLRPLIRDAHKGSLEVIPFGLDSSGLPPPAAVLPADGTSPIRVLAIGRLIWQKAHTLLLEACAAARDRGFDFHLRLVGEGPLRGETEEKIRALSLGDRTTLVGALPRDQVWAEYRNADVFVLSSVSEGSPFVILEAMAAGLPVIAPALHGIPEMIRDGRDGLLFRTGSVESLSEKLTQVLGNAILRKHLGSGAETSAKQFDHGVSVSRFRASLLSVLAAGGANAAGPAGAFSGISPGTMLQAAPSSP